MDYRSRTYGFWTPVRLESRSARIAVIVILIAAVGVETLTLAPFVAAIIWSFL
jgi:hypothetical protein